MTNAIIIDGWNMFGYNGVPNDTEKKKTVAIKIMGENTAEIFLNLETYMFELIRNNTMYTYFPRFSYCLKIADDWFKSIDEQERKEFERTYKS